MYVLKICFIHPIFHDHFVVPSGMSCTDSGLSLTHLMFSSSGSGVCVGASLPPSCSFFSCSLFLHFSYSFPISLPCFHVYWMKSPITFQFSSVQLLSHVWLFVTPWTAARQASLSITNSWSLLRLMSIQSVMLSNHLILCHPLLLLPSIFPSMRVFPNESVLWIRWPKYWSFSFNINPSNKHPGLISFRMDWLDLLAVQGTVKSLLQHHSSKASIFQCSAFFTVQLSHPYMTTRKTIALNRQTFVGKVMCLLFSMLSWLVITFLPGSKCLLFHGCNHHLQWFWSPPK